MYVTTPSSPRIESIRARLRENLELHVSDQPEPLLLKKVRQTPNEKPVMTRYEGMKSMNVTCCRYKMQTALTTNTTATQNLLKLVTLTANAVKGEGSGAVVPLIRVPLIKIVFVPLTMATVMRLEFVGSFPMTELRSVLLSLLSHPQTEYC
jgi:hypothetical protein